MVMTTVLFSVVARRHFGWRTPTVVVLCTLFFIVDIAFFGATIFKIPDGGWFPLVVGTVIFTVMTTWRTGRRLVRARLRRHMPPLIQFIAGLATGSVTRTAGSSAYLFSAPGVTPPSMIASVRHHDSLHEQVLVVCVVVEPRPRVPTPRRAVVTDLGAGFYQVVLHFGFMERPDVPKALAARVAMSLGTDMATLSYVLSRETITVSPRPGMAMWREHLYSFMSRNATGTKDLFQLPIDQTVEIGVGVEM
jgi:KUP system potassium uptake protein